MMLYNVEFSQDGKIFDDYIGDYVKAWNAEEAKDYALTWYIENGGKITACTMSMDVMGIKKDELIENIEYGGVATYMENANKANHNLFI